MICLSILFYLFYLLLLIHRFEYYFWLNKSSYRYALWTGRINSLKNKQLKLLYDIFHTQRAFIEIYLLCYLVHYISHHISISVQHLSSYLFSQINNKWAVVAVTWAFLDKSLPTGSSNAISRAWHTESMLYVEHRKVLNQTLCIIPFLSETDAYHYQYICFKYFFYWKNAIW